MVCGHPDSYTLRWTDPDWHGSPYVDTNGHSNCYPDPPSEDGVLGRSRQSARRAGRAGQHRVRGNQPLERGRIDKFGDDLAEQS